MYLLIGLDTGQFRTLVQLDRVSREQQLSCGYTDNYISNTIVKVHSLLKIERARNREPARDIERERNGESERKRERAGTRSIIYQILQ